jgi:hypothetical protein
MFRPLEKPPVDNPAWGGLLEMGPHRSQHASCLIFLARLEHRRQPTIFWKFIIVDECDKIACGMLQSLVTRQGNVLSRLTSVRHRDPTRRHELGDHALRASSRIIIGDDNGKRKSAVRSLLLQPFQQLPQHARPVKGTNADADVFLSSSHGSVRVRYAFIHCLIQRYSFIFCVLLESRESDRALYAIPSEWIGRRARRKNSHADFDSCV